MQSLDFGSGLHNCQEFSQPLECLYQAMQTQEKVFQLLKYCFFRKILLLCRLKAILFVNVKFHSKETYRIYAN